MSFGKVVSIVLGVLWLIFTVWLISIFATIAIAWKIAGIVAWVVIIGIAVLLIRQFFFEK